MDYKVKVYTKEEYTFNLVVSVEVKTLLNFTLLRIKHKSGNISTVSLPVDAMWETQGPVELI